MGLINTKNILFIMSGAFNNLSDIIKERLDGATIGFERTSKTSKAETHINYLKKLRTQDLVNFGLEPEFAGRLPVRVTLNDLSKGDLYDILVHTEASILEQYILSFKRFNIELGFSDDALHAIADLAHEEQIGARALSSTLEKIFREFKFELPSTNVGYVFATKELIVSPEQYLKKYLTSAKKQFDIDINNAISYEMGKRKIETIDTTDLLNQCQLPTNKGQVTRIIQTFFDSKHHVPSD